MGKIESLISNRYKEPILELIQKGRSYLYWKNYCKMYGINPQDLKTPEGKCYIPGHDLIGLFRHAAQSFHKKYPEDWPFMKLDSFYGHNGGTSENRLLIEQPFVIRMQHRSKDAENKYLFQVEISRKADGEIILAGLFHFVGTPTKNN